jgi:pimeloyl-ACP methyl ester carboxylesterase
VVATQRDVVGSIRILFRKLIGRRLGLPYEYPLLRMASVDLDGELVYVDDEAATRAAVHATDAVLLYVHGIIGDTGGMARSSAVTDVAPPPPLVGGRYGVLLTFDYENLNTSIADNARALGERLAAVGLGAGHSKRLDVVAHSMGGLVSRYFIELAGGAEVVSRLVTLGTPNGGSPWPTVQKWATVALTAALNGLTALAWPAQVLSGLLGAVERLDVTMDEMQAGSELLEELCAAPDPGVAYTVLIGNRSLIAGPDPDGVVRRLLARLSPKRIAGEVVDLAFLGKANDLAVAVSSGRNLPPGREPAPLLTEIACDHVSYFGTAVGLGAVAAALAVEPGGAR